MDIIDVDCEEFEKQRRESILQSGKYLRTEIIIGKETVEIKGATGHMPCIELEMHKVGPKEIGELYLVLKKLKNSLMDTYPEACLSAELTMETLDYGVLDYERKKKKNGKEDRTA